MLRMCLDSKLAFAQAGLFSFDHRQAHPSIEIARMASSLAKFQMKIGLSSFILEPLCVCFIQKAGELCDFTCFESELCLNQINSVK